MLEVLKKTLHTCPIVKRGEYTYFIHPITDGVPLVEPALLRDVACSLFKALDFSNVDKIIVTEAMGIHIGTVLSLMTDIPLYYHPETRIQPPRRGGDRPDNRLFKRYALSQQCL